MRYTKKAVSTCLPMGHISVTLPIVKMRLKKQRQFIQLLTAVFFVRDPVTRDNRHRSFHAFIGVGGAWEVSRLGPFKCTINYPLAILVGIFQSQKTVDSHCDGINLESNSLLGAGHEKGKCNVV